MSARDDTVFVVGALGMLAGHLLPKLEHEGYHVILGDVRSGNFFSLRGKEYPRPPLSRDGAVHEVDITDAARTLAAVERACPKWIINCAAYTAVDEAEKNSTLAFSVNSIGPANLARAAAAFKAKLLHVSSDYVFGASDLRRPLREEDAPAPCGIYGHSKRFGDELVQAILPGRHLIVRTSWLHGLYGPNFVTTIARLARERDEIRVVNDQCGSPTWAEALAEVIVSLLRRDAVGLYHVSCRGGITWYDFAQEIVRLLRLSTRVLPQTTAELGRAAPRPSYSVLSLEKVEALLDCDCMSWKDGVREHLNKMGLAAC